MVIFTTKKKKINQGTEVEIIDRNRNSSWRIEEELNKSRILDKPKKELYLRDERREPLPKKTNQPTNPTSKNGPSSHRRIRTMLFWNPKKLRISRRKKMIYTVKCSREG